MVLISKKFNEALNEQIKEELEGLQVPNLKISSFEEMKSIFEK